MGGTTEHNVSSLSRGWGRDVFIEIMEGVVNMKDQLKNQAQAMQAPNPFSDLKPA